MLESLADDSANFSKIPRKSVYYNACKKVIQRITDDSGFRIRYTCNYGEYRNKSFHDKPRAKIQVFCPPLLQYIQCALALAPPDDGYKPCEFNVVIHPDNRLLDRGIYSTEEGHESLSQLYDFIRSNAESGAPIDGFMLGMERERLCRYLTTRFDQVWIDQRIAAIATDKCTRDPIGASEFFKESKEHGQVALIVIMADPQVCDSITSTAPLVCPDNPVQQSQIYRLEEFTDVDDTSHFRWKTRYFCRIDSLYDDGAEET